MNKYLYLILPIIIFPVLTGCNTTQKMAQPIQQDTSVPRSLLSYGMVKKLLKPNVTIQAEVLKHFGSPNNMTYQSNGNELWIYDKVSTEVSTQSSGNQSGFGLGIVNSNAGSAIGALAGSRQHNSETTSRSSLRTLTVIMEFNDKSVLKEVSARKGGY
ncbi:MAG: hypothetical protein OQK35_03980 [Alphaproteobacteria bacterium]|nr:hypothetical protein [Alphaproteobacteria bacterium]